MAIRGIDGKAVSVPVPVPLDRTRRTQQTTNPALMRILADSFSDVRPAHAVPGPETISPGGGPGVTPSPQVVQTQHDLVKARQALGDAEQTLATDTYMAEHDPLWAVLPWNWGKLDRDQRRANDAQKTLASKTSEETAEIQKFGTAQVETARFQIFGEQLKFLEDKYGKSTASRLARQVYYNDPHWDVGSMSFPADASTLLQTGLPPKDDALMMAPNGDELDMSHVAVALDWQVNPPSILGVKSPVDIQDATLVGDLAQSSIVTSVSLSEDPNQSLGDASKKTFAGYAASQQLLGDIDGLNLAARLSHDPNASLSDTFDEYYAGAGPLTRMHEFAANSPFIEKSGGVPVTNAEGNYVLDLGKLTAATLSFAKAMRDNEKAFKWIQGKYSNLGWASVTDAQLAKSVPAIVSGPWAAWFRQEQVRERPTPASEPLEPPGRRGPFLHVS